SRIILARLKRDRDRPPRLQRGAGNDPPTKVLCASGLSWHRAATHNRRNNKTACGRTGRMVEESMSDKIYDVSAEWAKRAWVDDAKYRDMYARSVNDPNAFWAEEAKRIGWIKPF